MRYRRALTLGLCFAVVVSSYAGLAMEPRPGHLQQLGVAANQSALVSDANADGVLRLAAATDREHQAEEAAEVKGAIYDAAKQYEPILRGGSRQRRERCYITPEAVSSETFVLVDVREAVDFEQYHIVGSLSIPGYALKAKTFLKSQHVVLLNEGHSYHQLEELCVSLPQQGFTRVSILDGGLHAWRHKIGPLEGDPFAMYQLQRISPADFSVEKEYAHWAIVQVGGDSPNAIPRPSYVGKEQFVADLRANVQKQGKNPNEAYILMVTEHGEHYDEIQGVLQYAELPNVFYLQGGIGGYEAFLQNKLAPRRKVQVRSGSAPCCGN